MVHSAAKLFVLGRGQPPIGPYDYMQGENGGFSWIDRRWRNDCPKVSVMPLEEMGRIVFVGWNPMVRRTAPVALSHPV